MNRAKKMEGSNSVCKVVYSSSQFSWTKNHGKVKELEALSKAKIIAKDILRGKLSERIGKRTFFNHKRLGKRFKTPNRPIVLGQLVFY